MTPLWIWSPFFWTWCGLGQVAACDSFFEYAITHDMLPLRDAEFWLHGDFLCEAPRRSPARPGRTHGLLWNRYGLPAWEVQSMAYADYPARYAPLLMSRRYDPDRDAQKKPGISLNMIDETQLPV